MKLKNAIAPEPGEWYVISAKQVADMDIMGNMQVMAYQVTLAPVKSAEKQGADLMNVEFDTTKEVDLEARFSPLLRASEMVKSLKALTVAIEKRTGIIFKKGRENG